MKVLNALMKMRKSRNTAHSVLHCCLDRTWRNKTHTLLGRTIVASSSRKRRGPRSSIVSGDQPDGSLQRMKKSPSDSCFLFSNPIVHLESVLPKSLDDQLIYSCFVWLRNVFAVSHGPEAGVKDIRGQEAQLERLELTQERSKPWHILSGQSRWVISLQIHRKYEIVAARRRLTVWPQSVIQVGDNLKYIINNWRNIKTF